jgi:cyanuric acid amidohydrolase
MRCADIHVFEMAAPNDVSGLAAALDDGRVRAEDIVCVMAKTEGNGLDNDYTRAYATDTLLRLLGERLALGTDALFDRISFILSGGVEGVLSPHMLVFTVADRKASARAGGGLAIGRSFSRPIQPEEIGTRAQVSATAEAVRAAMAEAGLEPAEVAYVMAKGAVLTAERIADADRRGAALCAGDTHGSKPFTRAATALGIAAALGEMAEAGIDDAMIGVALERYSARACVTPGIDLPRSEILVFGNSETWGGDVMVAGTALEDMIDSRSVFETLRSLDLAAQPQLSAADRARLLAVIVKGGPSRDDRLRGRRHVMWHDSDVHALRHFRAAMGGMLAGLTGDTRIYIAAGAEHQGPPGGGTLAIFARRKRAR